MSAIAWETLTEREAKVERARLALRDMREIGTIHDKTFADYVRALCNDAVDAYYIDQRKAAPACVCNWHMGCGPNLACRVHAGDRRKGAN